MIVAMDGPAGCGKSTVAELISSNLGFLYLNSGHFYRAISYALLAEGIPSGSEEAVGAFAAGLDLACDDRGRITLSGRPLERELRSKEVDAIVSQVSTFRKVRDIVNALVRKAAEGRDVVVEGRDITTVVFPHADVKFYLDASAEIRARRRFGEGSSTMTYDEVLANIRMRDENDKAKPFGALKIAGDATYLDTSGLTIGQVYETVYGKILHVREAHGE